MIEYVDSQWPSVNTVSLLQFSLVQSPFQYDSLWRHGLQHARLPCPSPFPEPTETHVHRVVMPSNHLILCRPLLLPPSILPSIRVFSNESVLHIKWPKYWSFSFSIHILMNMQDWFPLGWTCWISLQPKGLSRIFSNNTVQKHQFFGAQFSL